MPSIGLIVTTTTFCKLVRKEPMGVLETTNMTTKGLQAASGTRALLT